MLRKGSEILCFKPFPIRKIKICFLFSAAVLTLLGCSTLVCVTGFTDDLQMAAQKTALSILNSKEAPYNRVKREGKSDKNEKQNFICVVVHCLFVSITKSWKQIGCSAGSFTDEIQMAALCILSLLKVHSHIY